MRLECERQIALSPIQANPERAKRFELLHTIPNQEVVQKLTRKNTVRTITKKDIVDFFGVLLAVVSLYALFFMMAIIFG